MDEWKMIYKSAALAHSTHTTLEQALSSRILERVFGSDSLADVMLTAMLDQVYSARAAPTR